MAHLLTDSDTHDYAQRVLALTGPAGVGKTATLRVLAKELNVEILEWRNGMDDVVDSGKSFTAFAVNMS